MIPRRLSLRRQVALVVVVVAAVAVLVSATSLLVLQAATFRRRAESELHTLADLVALSVNDAVVGFEPSPADAARALEVLRHRSQIDVAHIFVEPELTLFASAPAHSVPPPDLIARGMGFHPSGQRGLWLVRELRDDRGRVFARIALHSSLATLRAERAHLFLLLGATTALMMGLAIGAARRLHRNLTGPILAIADAVERIEQAPDPRARVPAGSNDEIGKLAAGINHMLEGLEGQAEALRETEGRMLALVDSAPAAIVVLDVETGHFVQVNENACRLFGRTRDELLRLGPVDVSAPIQPDHRPAQAAAADMIGRAMAGERPRFEWIHTAAAGAEVFCDIALVRLPAGDKALLCGIIVDITNRRRADERLRKSEAALEQAQALAHLGSWELDPRTRTGEWSREMYRLHGRSPELGPPTFQEFLQGLHPDDRSRLSEHFRRALTTGAGADVLYRTLPSLGPEREIQVIVAAGKDAEGQVAWLRGVCLDVTLPRKLDRERAAFGAHLLQTQKLEALGTLAGGIAHDFNNILTAITGNLHLVRLEIGAGHPANECLAEIAAATARASDLVQRILLFGRRREHALAPSSLAPVVAEAAKLLRATLPAAIAMKVDLAPGTPIVVADPGEVHQVVMNLVTNAWHAIDTGAGTVTIKLGPRQVDSRLCQTSPDLHPGLYAELTVTDTGAGMDAATLERIFEPFFTTKPQGQGTGLGLSMVHGIVKSHAGAVTVQSTRGEGTTFHVYFPADVDEATPAAPLATPPAAVPQRGAGEHILYLDDEEALVRVAKRSFGRLGYRVSTYTRPAEALAAFRASPGEFSLVFTDLNMPGLSGLNLAREVLAIRPDTAVVLTSGHLTDDEIAIAKSIGVREIVTKPHTVEQLTEVAQRLLGTAAARARRD